MLVIIYFQYITTIGSALIYFYVYLDKMNFFYLSYRRQRHSRANNCCQIPTERETKTSSVLFTKCKFEVNQNKSNSLFTVPLFIIL